MRIAILPIFGMSDTKKDSNFRVYSDLIKFSAKLGLPIHWYFLIPKGTQGLPELPNTTYIGCNDINAKDFYSDMAKIPQSIYSLFSWKAGKYPIDVFMTSKTMACSLVGSIITDNRRRYDMPIHLFEPLVRLEMVMNQEQVMSMVYGYAKAINWFLNEDERYKALNTSAGFLSPSTLLKMRKNSYVEGLPLSFEELDTHKQAKNEKFSIFWGARFSSEKNPQKVAELIEKLNSSGRDFDFTMTTQQASPKLWASTKEMGKGAIKTLTTNCDRPQFLGHVARSHMFVCTSRVEGFPTGFMEQLYLTDGVGIFPNEEWATKLLPPEYPFIYHSDMEAHTIIRWIKDNYDEALKKVSWVKDWLKSNYSGEIIMSKFYERLKNSVVPDEEFSSLGSLSAIVDEGMTLLGDTFTFDQIMSHVEKNADTWGRNIVKYLGNVTVYEIHRYVLSKGYRDSCESEYPVYIKNKNKNETY